MESLGGVVVVTWYGVAAWCCIIFDGVPDCSTLPHVVRVVPCCPMLAVPGDLIILLRCKVPQKAIISCLFRGLSLGLILQKKQAVTAFILPLSLSLSADKVHTTSFLNFPPPSRRLLVGLNKPFAKIRNLFRTPLNLCN